MKKYVILILTVIFFSCEQEESNYYQNLNHEDSVEKHFVSIDDIKEIIKGKQFKNFVKLIDGIENFKTNESITITDFTEYKDKNNVTAFYLTELSNEKNVLFAADDRSHLIMGITDSGNQITSLDNIPSEFSFWLDEEIEAIEFARDNYLSQTEEVENEWNSFSRVPPDDPTVCHGAFITIKNPLLTTSWGQGVGYNNLTPHLNCSNYSNGNAPTGCVATAGAQVLKYFQYPSNYSWSSMPNNYGSTATSQLMYNVGIACNMDYGCDGSGSKLYKLANGLINTFGYSSANISDFNYNVVLNEISQNKPVLMSGGERRYYVGIIPYYADGHAWVADGYVNSYTCSYDDNGYVTGG